MKSVIPAATVSFLLPLILFCSGIDVVTGQTTLGIVTTNNLSIIYWTATPGNNGVLESSSSLTSPNWLAATDAVPFNFGSGLAVAITNSAQARYFRLSLVAPEAGMVYIPAGSFVIGDPLGDIYRVYTKSPPPTNVYVSAFFMDRTLVTSNLWSTVYAFASSLGYSFTNPGYARGGNHPIVLVDWYDCLKWCNARSQWNGLTPVYYTDSAMTQVLTNGEPGTNVFANWSATGYRLPTEAEWEKAARGGLVGLRFPWGDTISWSQANYFGDSLAVDPTNGFAYDLSTAYGVDPAYNNSGPASTSPVASFPPNEYGLYDMSGNAAEICWDFGSAPLYSPGSAYLGGSDPHGPDPVPAEGNYRVDRGGDWFGDAFAARCADRDGESETTPFYILGFRCVRGPLIIVN
jgi:formylglycine-generating enzyme required for sulfatase activity